MPSPVDSKLRKAINLIKSGRLAEAEEIYQKILQKFPKNKKAIEGVKKLSEGTNSRAFTPQGAPKRKIQELIDLYNLGRFNEVVSLAQKLSDSFPEAFIIFSIMGASNASLNNLAEAEDNYRHALALRPDYADAHNNLANVLQEKGDLEAAVTGYKKALKLKPEYAEAYANLGNALKAQGKMDGALYNYKKALKIQPDNAENFNNLGVTQHAIGQVAEAIVSYKRAIQLKPDYVEAYNNAGVALKITGDSEQAILNYKQAIRLRPQYSEAHYNLGNIRREKEDLDGAIENYRQAIGSSPDHLNAMCNLASALNERGETDQAIKYCRKAISINPNFAEAHNNMGVYFREAGDLKLAEESFKKAIKAEPSFAEAYRNLSLVKRYSPGDDQIDEMQKILASNVLGDRDRCQISFALAKAYEDIGEQQRSFEALGQGNSLRKRLLGYNIERDEILFDKLKERDRASSNNPLQPNKDSKQPTPIFILGMPRSGTTLVEQIVSCHSSVTAAGELMAVSQLADQIVNREAIITEANLIRFREQYLARITPLAESSSYVTDKMPQNFLYLNLISMALPEAKIIHTQRDSSATCWSNFKTYFTKEGLGYCYDLEDVVEYYGFYSELMRYWDKRYHQRIYHLDYDQLTRDQEQETRKLLDQLGLEWEEACLFPERNERSSKTASSQQVRRKVYRDSSEQWKIYEPYLKDAFNKLR